MRKLLVVLAVLALPFAFAACQQASTCWVNTKNTVCGAVSNPCQRDECGRVYTDPVYDSWCASESRVGGPKDTLP